MAVASEPKTLRGGSKLRMLPLVVLSSIPLVAGISGVFGSLANRKAEVEIRSFGIYTKWDAETKELPRILKFTRTIPADVDVEFGLVVKIKRAKNQLVEFCIAHPGILDAAGKVRAPFCGDLYVKTNDWDFFLGDTIWEPIADKFGIWRLTIKLAGNTVVDESFEVIPPEA